MIQLENARLAGTRFGVAFLVKHGLVINKEYHNIDFNIVTSNEALVIDIDLSNNQNLILATMYCPNGNPNFRLFEAINNLPILSCLSAGSWKLSDVPRKTALVHCSKIFEV